MPKVRDEKTGRFTFGGRNPGARYTTNPIYCTGKQIVRRCTNPDEVSFQYYGGAGVTLHEPWLNYERFRHDVLELLGPLREQRRRLRKRMLLGKGAQVCRQAEQKMLQPFNICEAWTAES